MNEKKESKKSMNQLILTVIVVVVVAGASFFGGIKYQQNKIATIGFSRGSFGANSQNRTGGAMGMTNRGGFRPVSGQVISVDSKSMTVKLQDGSTRIVLLSATTLYSKSNSGSQSDVSEGTTVSVFGTENSDGSVTAQSVQLNPVIRDGSTAPSASPAANK